jgi:hypothetical protein
MVRAQRTNAFLQCKKTVVLHQRKNVLAPEDPSMLRVWGACGLGVALSRSNFSVEINRNDEHPRGQVLPAQSVALEVIKYYFTTKALECNEDAFAP